MTIWRRHSWRAWALVGGAAAGLAACSSTAHKTAPPTSPSSRAPVATTSTSAPGPTTPANSTFTGPAGPPACPTSELAISVGQSSGAAGTTYYPLIFRNSGSATCTLAGYPGVSFVSGPAGQQIGAPATRTPGTVGSVQLGPGQSAQASLGVAEAANFPPSCRPTQAAGLRVYPPNQTASVYVAFPNQTCANTNDPTLRIGPLSSGQ